MIAFRKAHPSICRSRFWREDVRWRTLAPHALAYFLRGDSQQDASLYVMINASPEDIALTIEEGDSPTWRRAVDTSLSSPEDVAEAGHEPAISATEYLVRSRSVVVLLAPLPLGEADAAEREPDRAKQVFDGASREGRSCGVISTSFS